MELVNVQLKREISLEDFCEALFTEEISAFFGDEVESITAEYDHCYAGCSAIVCEDGYNLTLLDGDVMISTEDFDLIFNLV